MRHVRTGGVRAVHMTFVEINGAALTYPGPWPLSLYTIALKRTHLFQRIIYVYIDIYRRKDIYSHCLADDDKSYYYHILLLLYIMTCTVERRKRYLKIAHDNCPNAIRSCSHEWKCTQWVNRLRTDEKKLRIENATTVFQCA